MAQRLVTADKAFDRIVDFLEHFTDLEDPRQRAKVLYPLDEVLLLCLLGVLAGCESWVEIAKYGEKKLGFLRRFRPFTDGTPSHDQLGDIFAALDAEQFQHCFIAWAASLSRNRSRALGYSFLMLAMKPGDSSSVGRLANSSIPAFLRI